MMYCSDYNIRLNREQSWARPATCGKPSSVVQQLNPLLQQVDSFVVTILWDPADQHWVWSGRWDDPTHLIGEDHEISTSPRQLDACHIWTHDVLLKHSILSGTQDITEVTLYCQGPNPGLWGTLSCMFEMFPCFETGNFYENMITKLLKNHAGKCSMKIRKHYPYPQPEMTLSHTLWHPKPPC